MATSLSSISKLPAMKLGSGVADATAYLRGDGTWQSTIAEPSYTVTNISGTAASITVNFSTITSSTIIINLPSGTTSANITFTNLAARATANTVFSFGVILSHVSALTSNSSIVFKHGSNVLPKWTGNIIPPSTTTAGAIDVWSFFTYDAGTSLIGSLAMTDVRNA
jgi:hypothetical protein